VGEEARLGCGGVMKARKKVGRVVGRVRAAKKRGAGRMSVEVTE
jgi:hypothetical protein